jgi:uncharacterized membrane protein (UPF0127 family)
MKNILFIFLIFNITKFELYSEEIIQPDSYTKEGYCIVNSPEQRYIGLTRFKTKKEFSDMCNGKMLFKYKKRKCRYFTMKNMKFNILINYEKEKLIFKIGERKEICSNKIIEEI